MTTTGRLPVAARSLVQADGSVVIRPRLAREFLRIVVIGLDAQRRANGGEVTPDARQILFALDAADEYAERQAERLPMSELGSSGSAQPRVELTTDQAAALLECTPRHVRRLVATGRVSGRRAGWAWLVNAASLDGFRTGSAPRDHDEDLRTGRDGG